MFWLIQIRTLDTDTILSGLLWYSTLETEAEPFQEAELFLNRMAATRLKTGVMCRTLSSLFPRTF